MTPSLHSYQQRGRDWILDHERCGLFLPMGAGKTLTTLCAIDALINDCFDLDKVLIIGPVNVIQSTWPDEIKKWNFDLSYSLIIGNKEQRIEALKKKADIYLISKDNVIWLCQTLKKKWDFDMVVIDELSAFKSPEAKRFRALRKMKYRRFVGLTGTPSPKGYIDLWSQLYLMDEGERLGKTLSIFRNRYFYEGARSGYVVYQYNLRKGAEKQIQDQIKDICMSISQEEYSTLPSISHFVKSIPMPDKIKKAYQDFKETYVLPESEISAANAAVLVGKLSQFTSGAIYHEDRSIETIHDLKLEALCTLVEEAEGENLLIFYNFRHERERILKVLQDRFKDQVIKALEGKKDIEDWNAGKISCLLLNPASAGHGLNLQHGGRIAIYYSLPNWNLELFEQAIARIHRQGQSHPVAIYYLLMKGTIDERQYKALQSRATSQKELLEALRNEGMIKE